MGKDALNRSTVFRICIAWNVVDSPYMWNNGSAPKLFIAAPCIGWVNIFLWLRDTDLGSSVDPELRIMTAISSMSVSRSNCRTIDDSFDARALPCWARVGRTTFCKGRFSLTAAIDSETCLVSRQHNIAIGALQKVDDGHRRHAEGKSKNNVAQTAGGKKGDNKVDVRGANNGSDLSGILATEVSPCSGDALERSIMTDRLSHRF